MIQIVWEFHAKPDRIEEFEQAYSSTGAWSALFARAPGYRGTTLARDPQQPTRYLVTDAWDDLASFHRFKRDFAEQYAALDQDCEALTERELYLGTFELI